MASGLLDGAGTGTRAADIGLASIATGRLHGPTSPAPAGPLTRIADATGLPDGPSLRSDSGPPPGRSARPMTTTLTPAPTTTEQSRTPTQGQRVELARYLSDTGERLLIGQRLDGIVHVFDEPATGNSPSFTVDTHLDTNSELQALVADYLAKAKRLGYAPMHGWY